jgi:hypothetical protein
MKEKSILAYFHSPEEAEGAASKLRALRAIDVSVDRFGKYPGDGVDETMNLITGNIPSLGWVTQDADFGSRSASILAAADVDASGMSDGGQDGPTGLDVVLSAVVDESIYEQARRVVQEAGGTM